MLSGISRICVTSVGGERITLMMGFLLYQTIHNKLLCHTCHLNAVASVGFIYLFNPITIKVTQQLTNK